jgi:magnesium transporter
MSTVVKCGLYVDGRLRRECDLERLEDFHCEPDEFIWIGIVEPDPELFRKVQDRFRLHDLAVEDALAAHQRPKLEEYGESLFVVVRTASWDAEEHHIDYGETEIFLGAHYVVTVRHGASLPYSEVRARCEASPQLLRKGPGYVLYALLDFIVDNYFPVMDALESAVEDLEDKLFSDEPDTGLTREIYHLRRELGQFKRILLPLLDLFHRLMRVDLKLVPDEIRIYFRDVYDHVVRINESLDQLRETVHSALEANLALISVRQNETMQMLAAWAAILAIPTLVAGLYGMNTDMLPGAHLLGGFVPIVGGMLIACVTLYWRFKRIGWL